MYVYSCFGIEIVCLFLLPLLAQPVIYSCTTRCYIVGCDIKLCFTSSRGYVRPNKKSCLFPVSLP